MCKEYVEKHYGAAECKVYEDEGFSGGSVDRPQFQRMLKHAKEKKFDVLVCYRLDRVSRNIADFSSLIGELHEHDISFVSLREQFDTTTPMGRAMMYIASVFAQLERETIAERIRDNMLGLAKTGRWLGGPPPLGFKSKRISYIDSEYKERSLVKLTPVKSEMKEVEFIYDKYLELGSIYQVRKYLINNNIKTKRNAYFSSSVISDILRNPAYVKADTSVIDYLESKGLEIAGKEVMGGEKAILLYNKKDKRGIKNDPDEWVAAIAKHKGHIEPEKWLQVQHRLDKNSMKLPRVGTSKVALLSGLIRCAKCGSPMIVNYGARRKDGSIRYYYVCNLKTYSSKNKCQNENVNGEDIDHAVIEELIALSRSREPLLEELERLRDDNKRTCGVVDLLDKLKSERKALQDEIDNLVGEIAKSAAASKYILPQIEARDEKAKELGQEISRLEKEREEVERESEGFDLVLNNIMSFADVIDRLSRKEKKNFLQTIVDKVYWDGDSGEVAIRLLSNIGLSQYCSASSRHRDSTAIILYKKVSSCHRYENYPEDTLGQKIRKQRFIKNLTAEELGELCGCVEGTIYMFESDWGIPCCATMERICEALDVPIEHFGDDYYNFVFSNNYAKFLREWRANNTNKCSDVEQGLGVTVSSYRGWEKGRIMSRKTFDKIRGMLGI